MDPLLTGALISAGVYTVFEFIKYVVKYLTDKPSLYMVVDYSYTPSPDRFGKLSYKDMLSESVRGMIKSKEISMENLYLSTCVSNIGTRSMAVYHPKIMFDGNQQLSIDLIKVTSFCIDGFSKVEFPGFPIIIHPGNVFIFVAKLSDIEKCVKVSGIGNKICVEIPTTHKNKVFKSKKINFEQIVKYIKEVNYE